MLFLIRHAESRMNWEKKEMKKKVHRPELLWDVRLVDAGITESGEEEILRSREEALTLPITRVYVSPLLRTLQTCHGLFHDHPNDPEIIVQPYATEVISDAADLSQGCLQSLYPAYDWSAFFPLNEKHWQESISDSPLLKSTVTKSAGGTALLQELCDAIERVHPEDLERREDALRRVEVLKNAVLRDREEGRNVAVVAHADVFRLFMSTFPGVEPKLLKNCQIFQFPY